MRSAARGTLTRSSNSIARRRRLAAANTPPHPQHLGELIANRVHRVQGGKSVLEHHRHVFSGMGAALLGWQRQHVGAAEPDRAARHPGRRTEQTHHGERADGLATSGLTDDRQRAPGGDGVRESVDGVDHALARAELDGEIVDLEQRGVDRVAHRCTFFPGSGEVEVRCIPQSKLTEAGVCVRRMGRLCCPSGAQRMGGSKGGRSPSPL